MPLMADDVNSERAPAALAPGRSASGSVADFDASGVDLDAGGEVPVDESRNPFDDGCPHV